jgi:DNA-binding NtrC family response regulator
MKLLLIDEEPQMLRLIGDYLANLGYEVHRACECDEALALFKNYQYSIVISGAEWENFGGSGKNLTQYIRNLPHHPLVVRLSESNPRSRATPAPGDEAVPVVEKPTSLLRLVDLMHEYDRSRSDLKPGQRRLRRKH